MIEKIYCINAKSYTCRRELMEEQFKKLESKIDYEYVDAIMYDDEIVYETFNHLAYNTRKTAQVAISLSNLICLKKIYENKYNIAGIIEDDIILVDNFYNKLVHYFENTPNIINVINQDKPYLIYLAG